MNCPHGASTTLKERTKKTRLCSRTFCCESRASEPSTSATESLSTTWNIPPISCCGGCGTMGEVCPTYVLIPMFSVLTHPLKEMDEINEEFKRADVALVVGANDVVNPAARNSPESPIYGMPILNADQAHNVVFLKRSMRPGFAGIDNELLYDPKTIMLFGDARESLTRLVAAVKAA